MADALTSVQRTGCGLGMRGLLRSQDTVAAKPALWAFPREAKAPGRTCGVCQAHCVLTPTSGLLGLL